MNIPLRGKWARGCVAVVDDADAPLVAGYRWRINKRGYVVAGGGGCKRPFTILSRLLLNVTDPDVEVDHRDGDKLNNRRFNIRSCTHAENGQNKGVYRNNKIGLKGVRRHRDGGWTARISVNSKTTSLGYFVTPELAHAAYCKAATELHGAFARFS